VAYALAVAMLGTTLPTPLYVIYQHEFGFSELMVTVIFATYAAGVIAALLLFGRISDQIGRRRALLPGLALSALSAVAFLLANGVGLLLAGRVLSGLSAGILSGTATATLLDFAAPQARSRATLVATMANIGGLACGPLLAGLLAEFAGAPMRLSFWVDLALLAPAVALVWAIPETVRIEDPVRWRPRRPRLAAEVRPTFLRAALGAFAGFAVLGLFAAVAPAFLGQILGVENHATVGLVVFTVFASSLAGQTALRGVSGDVAFAVGCIALMVGVGLVGVALALSSLAALVAGAVVAGVGHGLNFRAGLAAINEATPPERRAEVASSFFVVAYAGISAPVLGVGLVAELVGLRAASLIFVAIVALLAMTDLVLVLPRTPSRPGETCDDRPPSRQRPGVDSVEWVPVHRS
jgi:MFS family permease